jgi:hypothetical protein
MARLIISFLSYLAGVPGASLVRLSDDADEIWEPFLRDIPADLILQPV